MMAAAETYYQAIESAEGETDPDKVTALRERLDRTEERFADNPAYVAFLRLQRAREEAGMTGRTRRRRFGRRTHSMRPVDRGAASVG